MSILHTFNYINLNYPESFTVSLQSLNYLSSILGLNNMSSYINFDQTLDLLVKDLNYFNSMNELYYLIVTHPDYVASGATLSGTKILFSNLGDASDGSSTFTNVTLSSVYDFITQSDKLYSLRDRLGNNQSLNTSFVSSTNEIIYQKLLSLRVLITATSSTGTTIINFNNFQNNGYFLPIFSFWSSKTINTSATPLYITPIKSYDFNFICFICYLINQGVNNLLLDVNDQGVIEFYGLDNAQIINAYTTATNSTVITGTTLLNLESNGTFNVYCLQVKTLISYCIALLNEIKNQVLMKGLPTYYILYCAFLLAMTKRKNQMIQIAKLNITTTPVTTTLSFYPSGDITNISNCILFSDIYPF